MGMFSYKNKVRATIIGDKAYFPNDNDIQCIRKAFEDELSILGNAVGIRNIFTEDNENEN
jgi:hypothetical protein